MTVALRTFAVSILFLTPAYAFEGGEHSVLANASLAAALLEYNSASDQLVSSEDRTRAIEANKILKRFYDGLQVEGEEPAITYGDIVRLIDYIPDSYSLFNGKRKSAGWPESLSEINVWYLQDVSQDRLSLAQSSHGNQNHFQGRAVQTYWLWHDQATAVAANGNLWGALLLNAYADHFLQDSFAPGHIVAPRDHGTLDLWALAIHDAVNANGLNYTLHKSADLSRALALLGQVSPTDWVERFAKKPTALPWSGISELLSKITAENLSVTCRGDGRLSTEPLQVALVSAYCTQSILDIVHSFVSRTKSNSFQNYTWDLKIGVMVDPGNVTRIVTGQREFIDYKQGFGELACTSPVEDDKVAAIGQVKIDSDHRPKLEPIPLATQPALVASFGESISRNRLLGFTFGAQSLSAKDTIYARGMMEVETLVAGQRWDQLREQYPNLKLPRWPAQFALTLGYSGIAGSQSYANGVLGRILLPAPPINGILSAYVGGRYHSRSDAQGFRTMEGIRGEWGFGLAFLYLGLGHDYQLTADGFQSGLSLETGATLHVPISRFRTIIPFR